ncbi:MAG: hypothetical protein V1918_04970 [Planctomycetota bacterium]
MSAQLMTEVVFLTASYRVQGDVAIPPGERLTDYMRRNPEFIAVTNAQVCDKKGALLFRAEFVNVHHEHIEVALPADMIRD